MATPSSNLCGEYKPPRALAIVVCVVFIVLSLVQTWRIIRTHRWFGFTIVIDGLFEIDGLTARIYSCTHLSDQGSYGAQIILILLAPIFFAASIYMFLGRLITSPDCPSLYGIRTRWLSQFFVVGDVLCFLIQVCGAGIFVSGDNTSEQTDGENAILAGLALQVVTLIVFITFAIVFDATVIKKGYPRSTNPNSRLLPKMAILYLCSTLIMFRNIFHLVEFGQGEDGYLLAHEWPVYVLDIMFMAFVMVSTMGWYNGEMMVEKNSPALQPMSENS
ncbi:RTA1 like protein-domain-containing protein [Fusarium tricinctum]|uniref:RTA1 like protein-domain-containing protein n=1 Tax=Fusarium tricinctum TaxID=61284 RepID=A0A8K0RUP6_9HYPO|nr:RTA1 like protein-domain-containing protein [Fusarium tricinctum]